tara:strand:+ start:9615 stop:10283 length:669 start_codon:yes stop_codon:yes gene_type:complete
MLHAKIDLDKMQEEQEIQLSVEIGHMENNFLKARQDAVVVNKVISLLEQRLTSAVIDTSESWLEKLEVCPIVAQSEKTSLRLTLKTFESVDDFQSFIGELPLEPLILTEDRDPLILPRYESSFLEESAAVMSDTGSKYVLSVRRKHSMTIIDITAFMVIHGHVIEVVGKIDSSDKTLYIKGTEGDPDAPTPQSQADLFNSSSLTSVYTVKRRSGGISKFYVY